jgi:hypothetical protein
MPMQNQDVYKTARRRVEAKLGFYIHVAIYVIVNALLVFLNLTYTPQYLWFLWPVLGWGIGIFFHALGVFIFPSGSPIKERMIEREIEKLASGRKEHPE